MVVTSTLISGFSFSKRFTASCWYWLRPDSVCWLSQNFKVTVSSANAGNAAPASAAHPMAPGTYRVPRLPPVTTASQPAKTTVEVAKDAMAAAWFLKNVVVVFTAVAAAWYVVVRTWTAFLPT